ncbi:hypothetical protein HYPDE_27918 [Hyphomicrobium denitrificans 1NES1]|uniref:Uncharacterized protein n=1 Tax=Hyphomicrobium denitrificans 1NES1 TaxID=670307 RepID=N0B2Q1_9HYPH|nr:hypothetical protein [Hyphomicrobium denitrificans]AGK57263.1 hypothetical protein HYPDE_27918 [Hyphomicrobium denitrificans 1NES1]
MGNRGPLEDEAQIFSGVIKVWRTDYGELITDSGVTVPLVTRGYPTVPIGARVTIIARKYKPLFQIEKIVEGS